MAPPCGFQVDPDVVGIRVKKTYIAINFTLQTVVFIWPISFHAKPCLCCSLNRKNNPIDITGTCFTMTTSNCNATIYLHDYNPLFFDNESNFWWCRKCWDHNWYPKKEKQNGIKTFAKTCLFSINRKNNPIKITGTCFKMTSSTCNAKTNLYYWNTLLLDKESIIPR